MNHTRSVALLALCMVACSDPLVDPQTVIGLRILGASLSASEQPAVARVRPGEDATLRWLVVAETERSYRARTVFCAAVPGKFGVPRCGATFLEQELEGTTDADLSFAFELPDDFSTEQEWLSFLALCEQGEPRWSKSTQRFSCTSDEQPITGFYQGIGHEQPNHNPNLQDDKLRINGSAWAADEGEPTCDADDIVRLRRDEVSSIQLTVEGADSEPLDDTAYGAASAEALTFIHVATTAGLSRAFSAVEPEAKSKRFELEFVGEDAWADVGEQRLGSFFLVVSDGRGGSDWVKRSYCLTK